MSTTMTDTGIPAGDRLGRARQCVIGCFAGQAIGGSVGAGVQFLSQAAFAERYGQEWPDGYPTAFGGTGLITAETQLALFTLDGMVRAHVRRRVTGETDPLPEVRLALTRWLRSQKPDAAAPSGWLPGRPQLHARRWPDTTTVSVLESGHFGTLEEPVNDSAEAGVLPRAAAAALWSADERVVFELGARIAALTHGHPTAYLSAGAYAVIINRLVRGIGNPVRAVAAAQAVLASWAGHEPVTAALEAALAPYYEGEGTSVTAAEVARLGTGQTAAEALAMAVCAGLSSPRFEHAIASATGHGGNTTTVGALTGGLFGTLFDFTSVIQVPLLRDLELGEEIATLGDAAVKEFGPTPPTAPSWREHFPFQD